VGVDWLRQNIDPLEDTEIPLSQGFCMGKRKIGNFSLPHAKTLY
jgi:hypothetical protein